jgi:ribonuclease P protein component
LIWRVRGTRAFEELRRGHRASDGPLTVVVVPDRDGAHGSAAAPRPPQVAYAIGRRTGGAVTRNRLRRQLREILRELPQPDVIGPGTHLVVVRPEAAGASSHELREHLVGALTRARRRAEAAERVA